MHSRLATELGEKSGVTGTKRQRKERMGVKLERAQNPGEHALCLRGRQPPCLQKKRHAGADWMEMSVTKFPIRPLDVNSSSHTVPLQSPFIIFPFGPRVLKDCV